MQKPTDKPAAIFQAPLITPRKRRIREKQELQSPCLSTSSRTGLQSDVEGALCFSSPPPTPKERDQNTIWGAVEVTLETLFAKHTFLAEGLEEMLSEHREGYLAYLLDSLPPTAAQVQRSNLPLSVSDVSPSLFQVHLANLAWKSKHDVRLPAGPERVRAFLPHLRTGPHDGCWVFGCNPLRLRPPTGPEHDIEPFEMEADKGTYNSLN